MKRFKKISLLAFFAAAVGVLASPAVHAQINTGLEYGSATGLGGGDIRTTVARIIQVFLGVLGVVALVLIVYAGFLWMTAGGNEERVEQAKRIMTQAAIGLAIVLSSFAITSFIVSKLVEATTDGGTGGPCVGAGCGGGGVLPGGNFSVQSITPPDDKPADFLWPKNSQVHVVLRNGVPDPGTVANSVTVSANGLPVSGTVTASGNVLVFKATAACEENPAYTCLPGNANLTVTVSPTLQSSTGKALFCGNCSATFLTSNLIDTQGPTVSIASPIEGQSVSVNAFVPVIADATDDSAVAAVEFFANDVSLGSTGVSPWQQDWDTTGIPEGTNVTVRATATDVVGNQTLANPVHVIVRPAHCFNGVTDGGETGLDCGDGCGACGGGECTEASQCASGLCVEGRCVNRPRIDAFDPLSGGPGTLVSIQGMSFGDRPGEVIFMGSDANGDERVAAPCAASAWTNTQVIVGVPEGAVSGPIQIANSDNYSDRTNDDFGPVLLNFTVNTEVRPGICAITPDNGPTGTTVTLSGNGYGDTQGEGAVAVAERIANVDAWQGTQITMTTPNILGGVWPVQVTANGFLSNRVRFSVPAAASGFPHIDDISPESGPVGEYVTIFGTNFGNSPGKIEFISGNDTVLGSVDFPAACGTDFWHNNSVTVKVPSGLPLGESTVRLVRADAAVSDNTKPFAIENGIPDPGICRISPSTGPVGTAYEINGERLGSDRGRAVFNNNVDASSLLSAWNDGTVGGAVPQGAIAGQVFAVSADGRKSNPLNFNVADCRQSQVCRDSEECCGDGTCRPPNSDGSSGCARPRQAGNYIYRFSTGEIPQAPQVVEQVSCTQRSQSPSPYKNVTDACANSVLGVRFTLPMDRTTLVGSSFRVTSCGNEAEFDQAGCLASVNGSVIAVGAGNTLDDGMQFTPAEALEPNRWYLATVSQSVRSLSGIPMEDDYVWRFRVRNSSDPCEIASVSVSPAMNALTDLYDPATRDDNENVTYSKYKADPANEVCNLLDCTPYVWNWATSQTAAVGIVNPTVCQPEVQALDETTGSGPAQVTATAQGKTGTGDLTIKFAAPRITDRWPFCNGQEACVNAEVGAAFNVAIQDATPQNVLLFACNNETCAAPTPVSGYTVQTRNAGNTHEVIVVPSGGGPLAPNAYYRVTVLGGSNGILSRAGAELQVNGTYVYGPSRVPAETWVFRTSDKRCSVDRLTTVPAKIATSIVGSYHAITAIPVSSPDACSANGLRLEQDTFDMAWDAVPAPPGAADLFRNGALNVSPLLSQHYATSSCLNTGSVSKKPVCGNGSVEDGSGRVKAAGRAAEGGGEECDLGSQNSQSGSGCSANCLLTGEPNSACGNGNIDSYTLGDGRTSVREQCDLGSQNSQSGSGCSANCLRLGSNSITPPSTCGNNDVADNEQCDDGNRVDGDGCSSSCMDEGSLAGPFPVCGNGTDNGTTVGTPETGEDCDLGPARNGQPGSGCSANCLFVGTSTCTASGQSNCCGNGTTDAGEALGCDLGWSAAANKPSIAAGCDSGCLKAGASVDYAPPSVCGDGVIGIGETNDPGAVGTQVDSRQYAHAVGGGSTVDADGKMISTITATADGKSGQTEFVLQCGWKTDSDCSRFDPDLRLGTSSCCYPRVSVVRVVPANDPGRTNPVCRNTLLQAEFNRAMDANTLSDKTFTVSYSAPAGGCPKEVTVAPRRGIWTRIGSWFAGLFARIAGRTANAQASTCSVSGSVILENRTMSDGTVHGFASFVLSRALPANTAFSARIASTVKSSDGVSLGGDYAWTFATGTDICTLDALDVSPSTQLFTSVYAGVDDPSSEATFVAQAVHISPDGSRNPIASVPSVYSWRTGWSSASEEKLLGAISGNTISDTYPTDSNTAKIGVKAAKSGQATVTAAATITADTLNSPSSEGDSVVGHSEVTVMLCKNPWPARNAVTNAWNPAPNPIGQCSNNKTRACNTNADCGGAACVSFNYVFYYCRDAGEGQPLLPALRETPGIPANQGGSLGSFLYTYTGAVGSLASEGIGIRVEKNPLHMSAVQWYLAQGFKGNVSSTAVDGYDAVKDGRSVYVNAPAIDVAIGGSNYGTFTNIYIISYTNGAGAETQNILGQILKNMRFAANRDANGRYVYSDQNVCSNDPSRACESDLDCSAGSCLVARSKVRRDVKRLADLRLISGAVQLTKDKNGILPTLAAGSFLPGRTVSTWPSWTKQFATELGGAPPVDPLNKMAPCPAGSDYEEGTCWSASNRTFACPAGSHVYSYSYPNGGYYYGYEQESTTVNFSSNCRDNANNQSVCSSDPLCIWNTGRGVCENRYGSRCSGVTVTATPGVCGNGIVEGGSEECEKGVSPTRTISCGAGASGTQIDTCGSDCRWIAGQCQMPRCGNGVVEGNEACDQGQLNGSYGHCNSACTGIGQSCGDGFIQQGESCDAGRQNGQYGSMCSLDCHSKGNYCGDRITNGPEQCDGNVENSSAALAGGASDSNGQTAACGLDSNGYQTQRTRTCAVSCGWETWGPCLPAGSCGNGTKDGNEQCDSGSANSDTGGCTTQCKKATCGDSLVNSGVEQCDEGAGNIDPNDTTRIDALALNCSLASCYYCSTSCRTKAVSGGYCGDNVVNVAAGEECEADQTQDAACVTPGGYNGTKTRSCEAKCKWGEFGDCIATEYCGDGAVNDHEICDGINGTANDGQPGHCKPDCSNRICELTKTFVASNVANTVVSTNADMSGAVPVTDVSGTYNGGSFDKLNNPQVQYVWSAGISPPNADVNPEIKYFQQTFTLDCELPAGTHFILHMNVDDDVTAIVNGNKVPANPNDAYAVSKGITMGNLKNPGYKYARQFDVTSFINPGSVNTLNFIGHNYYGPAFLAYWLETTLSSAFCGNGAREPGEQCDGGSYCDASCICLPERIASDGATRITDSTGNADLGPAFVLPDSFVSNFSWAWGSIPGAQFLWSFDESNTANTPSDWGTALHTEYFKRTFSFVHGTSSVVLRATADNRIDWIKVDGQNVGNVSPLVVMGRIYAANLTPLLVGNGQHTVVVAATNLPTPNRLTDTNPASVAFSITSAPYCPVN